MKYVAATILVIASFGLRVAAQEVEVAAAPEHLYCSAQEAAPDTLFRSEFQYSDLRQEYSDVAYHINLWPSNTAPNVHITQFKNVWGRNTPNGAILDWPQRNFAAIFTGYDKTRFIATKFTVPLSGMATTLGKMRMGDNYSGPKTTVSISQICGEFNPMNLGANCLATNKGKSEQIAAWKLAGTNAGKPYCELTPGQEYYLNIVATDPSASSPDCVGNICKMQIQNSF